MNLMERLFSLDNTGFDTPEGARALDEGLLKAKKDALGTAQIMSFIGRPLEIIVLLVSFLHIYVVMASIKPAEIAQVVIRPELFHLSEGAFTLMIDGALLYVITAASVARYVGDHRWWNGVTRWFFYILTALGNGIFIWKNSENLVAGSQNILPWLNTAFVICLTVLVPIALVSIELGHRRIETTRLGLLVETTVLDSRTSGVAVAREKEAQKQTDRIKELSEALWKLQAEFTKATEELKSQLAEEIRSHQDSLTRAQAQEEALSVQNDTLLGELDASRWTLISLEEKVKSMTEQLANGLPHPVELVNYQATPLEESRDCIECGKTLTMNELATGRRPFWQARLGDIILCKDCRESHRHDPVT